MPKIDITGQRFGRLVVIEEAGRNKHRNIMWLCQCDCGNTKVISGISLRVGDTKSCGCLSKELLIKRNIKNNGLSKISSKDETGNRYNHLLILNLNEDRLNSNKYTGLYWNCVCDCGNKVVVSGYNLRSEHTKSCGCLQKDIVRERFLGKPSKFKGITGKNHPNYNHGITDEERELGRDIPGYKDWRYAVYERDNYTCQHCGVKKSGTLNAHHLDGYNNNKELRTTLSNGITLCEECHKDFHHQYSRGNNTKEQFEDFTNNKE